MVSSFVLLFIFLVHLLAIFVAQSLLSDARVEAPRRVPRGLDYKFEFCCSKSKPWNPKYENRKYENGRNHNSALPLSVEVLLRIAETTNPRKKLAEKCPPQVTASRFYNNTNSSNANHNHNNANYATASAITTTINNKHDTTTTTTTTTKHHNNNKTNTNYQRRPRRPSARPPCGRGWRPPAGAAWKHNNIISIIMFYFYNLYCFLFCLYYNIFLFCVFVFIYFVFYVIYFMHYYHYYYLAFMLCKHLSF